MIWETYHSRVCLCSMNLMFKYFWFVSCCAPCSLLKGKTMWSWQDSFRNGAVVTKQTENANRVSPFVLYDLQRLSYWKCFIFVCLLIFCSVPTHFRCSWTRPAIPHNNYEWNLNNIAVGRWESFKVDLRCEYLAVPLLIFSGSRMLDVRFFRTE